MKRIGVFVCHCGKNIADTVDVRRVVQEVGRHPAVHCIDDYAYMCSEPGQNMIKETVEREDLEAVVIAACSPSLHEETFRATASTAGMNRYQCEIANIREQCSWVHVDRERATRKAIRIILASVRKVSRNEALEPIVVPITQRALVIGGGISGIQAALDIADSGYEVLLVEKEPSLGGHMAQLSETFPTLDCSQCILTPKMVRVAQHPKITLMTCSQVEALSGHVGNFRVSVRQMARSVDLDKCTGCGDCLSKCRGSTLAEFDRGLRTRKAIYVPFPQAVPNAPVIDRKTCLYFQSGKCGLCAKVCQLDAIDYAQHDRIVEFHVGAVVVATGFRTLPTERLTEYSPDETPDLIDGLAFERLLSASGPTSGQVRRPSDNAVPKDVVFVQCAGSRDSQRHKAYCSKICCTYTAKHALLYKHRVPDGQPFVFYIDVRTGGKGCEEFYRRVREGAGVVYLRGKVAKIFRDGEKTIVWGTDTLTGRNVEIAAELVVLSTAIEPDPTAAELAKVLKIQLDKDGFFAEAHPKLRPLESMTAGFFLAGCAQGPKDIPESVAQASGAASKVASLFSRGQLQHEPAVAYVDEALCAGCRLCISACPYAAREFDVEKGVVTVHEATCEGCGVCVSVCPCGATQQRNLTDTQVGEMITASLGGDDG